MLNEQFTWLTPFSQQESPELTWRDRRNGGTERLGFGVSFSFRRAEKRESCSVRLRYSVPPFVKPLPPLTSVASC